MEKTILLLDSDGVMCDISKEWCKRYNEKYGDNLTVEQFHGTWSGMEKVVKPECGVKVYDIIKEPGFFENLNPLEGAIEGLELLCKQNDIEPYILTAFSGHENIAYGKMKWYKKHCPFFNCDDNMILTHAKSLVHGDILVDDSVKNLTYWANKKIELFGDDADFITIAMAAPHNTNAEDNPKVTLRVEGWNGDLGLLKYLRDLCVLND